MTLNEGDKSNRIGVVFDTYRENSIKNSERLKEVKRVDTSCKLSQGRRSSGSGGVSSPESGTKTLSLVS